MICITTGAQRGEVSRQTRSVVMWLRGSLRWPRLPSPSFGSVHCKRGARGCLRHNELTGRSGDRIPGAPSRPARPRVVQGAEVGGALEISSGSRGSLNHPTKELRTQRDFEVGVTRVGAQTPVGIHVHQADRNHQRMALKLRDNLLV